jgi:peptidoglycan hydrolase-like protein with peptidoglycan-binding domain
MTIAKDFSAKALVAIVAASLALSSFATSANAQTTEELQKMINDLLAQVAALQGQVGQGGNSVASGICPYTWTRDLTLGAKGADVMKLQQFLNADADTRVAVDGAGSAGMETEFYGPATAAAVSKMQVKYRADILSPANLVSPTGYFGPSTRAKANSLCVATPVVTPTEPTTPVDEDEDEDEEETFTLGGEADLRSVDVEDADQTDLQEGDKDAPVAIVTVEFESGDAEINRLDINVTSVTSSRPWNVFESFSLWVDGDEIATAKASSKSNYLGSDNENIRFSNLGLIAEEGEELEIVVAATIRSSIRSDIDRGDWDFTVDSLRFFDADGVATTESDFGDVATINIDIAGADDEVRIKRSSSDPKEVHSQSRK